MSIQLNFKTFERNIPMFVSIFALLIGLFDLYRGFMHTFLLQYSAHHFAHLNLNSAEAADLLKLLGIFGISNYITGTMLILCALRDRFTALLLIGIIPFAYHIGIKAIEIAQQPYPMTQSLSLGKYFMRYYLFFCLIVFFIGLFTSFYLTIRQKNAR